MGLKLIIMPVALLMTACNTAPQRPAFQGYPFVEVAGISPEEVQSRFSVNCLEGGRIVQSTQFSVTCARSMGSSTGELLYRALATERYSSNPDVVTQSAWAKTSSGKLRVTTTMWLEYQNAFGKSTRDDLNDDNTKHMIQSALDKFKLNVEQSKKP